ncbi:right-handed parallel beta-helix repeat-containing protein [bacterium]|nr:right-handed parallel beta-helix repeat-containing protein [candidate division CSSED10-310 bacterium]
MRSIKQIGMVIGMVTLLGSTLFARTWHVSSIGDADFDQIQQAIDCPAVKSGDEIVVMPGVYREFVLIPAHLKLFLHSSEGSDSTEIMRPANDPRKMTVLIRSESVFQGFTVCNNPDEQIHESAVGYTNLPYPGVFPKNTAGITVTGPAKILNNVVYGHRFGMVGLCAAGAQGKFPVFRFNDVYDNTIGVGCCETKSIVRDNIIHDNLWLGVIAHHASVGEITNNLIIRNGRSGRKDSSGILCWQAYDWSDDKRLAPYICGNTIHGNYGDGIRCIWERGDQNTPIIINNIISGNQGYGIACLTKPGHEDMMPCPSIRQCNIWGNQSGAMNPDIRLVDCISKDPGFESFFLLSEQSPCKDRGGLPVNWGSTSMTAHQDDGDIDLGFHYPVTTLKSAIFQSD